MPQKYKTLSDYFEQTGKTQQSLATKLGVSRACVSYWVAGQREPSLAMALRISDATGVPVASLLKHSEVA